MVTACLCDVAALIALRLGVPVDGVWSTNSAEELLRIVSIQATSCRYETLSLFSHTYMYTLVRDVVIFVAQLSGDNTFEDVCPLLGNTNYTQHVRVATDLQLNTTNLPDVVRRIHKFNATIIIIVHLHFSLTTATVTIVLLEIWRLMLLGMMRLLSLVESFKMMYVNTWTCL